MSYNYAPWALQGLGNETPAGYTDNPFTVVQDIALTASQSTTIQTDIQKDADFIWKAILIATATGSFLVRFSDSRQYQLSSALVTSANYSSDPAAPSPLLREFIIPAGGKIAIEITDTSAAPNTIQLNFHGIKRTRG